MVICLLQGDFTTYSYFAQSGQFRVNTDEKNLLVHFFFFILFISVDALFIMAETIPFWNKSLKFLISFSIDLFKTSFFSKYV